MIYTFMCFLLIFGFGCSIKLEEDSAAKASGRKIGSLKGLQALEDTLNERIARPDVKPFDLQQYLNPEEQPTGLSALLGAFTEAAGFSVQENAVPNPVNTLLWEIVSRKVSEAIAEEACGDSNVRLTKDFFDIAHDLCLEVNTDNLKALWLSIARYDAPETEMSLWIQEENGAEGIAQTTHGKVRLALLMQTILMNPYFMLEH